MLQKEEVSPTPRLVYALYNFLLCLIAPFIVLYFSLQALIRYRYRWSALDRLFGGRIEPTEEETICIWMHAISLGETYALAPLFQELKQLYPHARFVLSSLTEAGYARGSQWWSSEVDQFIMPIDWPYLMKSLVNQLKPALFIYIESGWWPNLNRALMRANCPYVLIDGRISEKSWQRYRYLHTLLKPLWHTFAWVTVTSTQDRDRLIDLGVRPDKIVMEGSLKLAFETLPSPDVTRRLASYSMSLPCIALCSTHEGEELLLIAQLQNQLASHGSLIIAPRHTERVGALASTLKTMGYSVALWTQAVAPCQLLIIDVTGILHEVYRYADLVLVGGSWIEGIGGHNFFEPVMAGAPTFYGPYIYKQVPFHQLAAQQGVASCIPLDQLGQATAELLSRRKEDPGHTPWLDYQQSARQSVKRRALMLRQLIDRAEHHPSHPIR